MTNDMQAITAVLIWTPWDSNSAAENCLWRVYWGVRPVVTSARVWGKQVWTEVELRCSCNKINTSQPHQELQMWSGFLESSRMEQESSVCCGMQAVPGLVSPLCVQDNSFLSQKLRASVAITSGSHGNELPPLPSPVSEPACCEGCQLPWNHLLVWHLTLGD